jgi:hypothetical protein
LLRGSACGLEDEDDSADGQLLASERGEHALLDDALSAVPAQPLAISQPVPGLEGGQQIQELEAFVVGPVG